MTLYRLVILAHGMSVSVRIFAEQGRTSKSEPMLNLKPSLFIEMEISPLISISCAQPTALIFRDHPSRYQGPEIKEIVKADWGTRDSMCPNQLF